MVMLESSGKKINRNAETELVEFGEYWWAAKTPVESSEDGNFFKTR